MRQNSVFSWAALGKNWGGRRPLSPWIFLPVGGRQGKANGSLWLQGCSEISFGVLTLRLASRRRKILTATRGRCGRAAPRQALPLPRSFFFIFVTVLKPAARLGN